MKLKNKRTKKFLYSIIGTTTSLIVASTIIASCTSKEPSKIESKTETQNNLFAPNTDYNFGIATEPVNSLNYLKFASLRKLAPLLVEGLVVGGPKSESKTGQILGVGSLYVKSALFRERENFDDLTEADLVDPPISNSYTDLSRFNYLAGNTIPYIDDKNLPILGFLNSNNRSIATKYTLNNGASKWSDGKEVDAQDHIDGIQYILDLNSGSQLKSTLLHHNIRNSNEFNQAQEEYIRVHKKPYINPFGRRPYIFNKQTNDYELDYDYVPFAPQTFDENGNPVDDKEVSRIRNAVLAFGLSTGKMFDEIPTFLLKEALQDKYNVDFEWNKEVTSIYLSNQQVAANSIKKAVPAPELPGYQKLTLHKNPYFNRLQKFSFVYRQQLADRQVIDNSPQTPLAVNDVSHNKIDSNKATFSLRLNKVLENQDATLTIVQLDSNGVETQIQHSSTKTFALASRIDFSFENLDEQKSYIIKSLTVAGNNIAILPQLNLPVTTQALKDQSRPALLTQNDDLFAFSALPKSEYELLMEYETFGAKSTLYRQGTDVKNAQQFLPAHRKFIETNGGIEKFGSSKENFIWSGPYDIGDMELGSGGFIYLNKNNEYFDAKNVLSDRIKIFFNSQPNVTSLWFEEGLISSTTVAPAYQLKFWANENYRKLLKKNQGFGTVGIQFNLDAQSRYGSLEEYEANKNKHIPILDPDLRRALAFATNRESILRLTGWTSSFPVSTWTAFGTINDSRGRALELWFDNVTYETEHQVTDANGNLKNKSFLLQNNTFKEHSAKNYTFENVDRTDRSYDVETANFYLERYKQNHKDQDKVVLTFVYASQPDENQKAAVAFQDLIHRAFGGYVEIELKSLPSNTYVSFLANGQFDISYQNFDKYAQGSGYGDALLVFFTPDGIEYQNRKTQGYELNPSGSWTFADFFNKFNGDEQKLKDAAKRLRISDEDLAIIKELAFKTNVKTENFYNPQELDVNIYGKELEAIDKAIPQFKFIVSLKEVSDYNNLLDSSNALTQQQRQQLKQQVEKQATRYVYLDPTFKKQAQENNASVYVVVESELNKTRQQFKLEDLNKKATLDEILKQYDDGQDIWDISNDRDVYSFSTLGQLVNDSYSVVDIRLISNKPADAPANWVAPVNKLLVEPYEKAVVTVNGKEKTISSNVVNKLLFKTKIEDHEDHRNRIRSFFASKREGWKVESDLFRVITQLEKIIREDVPILSIMDTDTNWSISSIGGGIGEYIYTLRNAYDYRRPPRPRLPTSAQEDE